MYSYEQNIRKHVMCLFLSFQIVTYLLLLAFRSVHVRSDQLQHTFFQFQQ